MAKNGIANIAARAGVSPSAVSRALRGKGGLSQATRDRILRIADKLNYRPSAPQDAVRKTALLMPHRPRCADSYFFRESYNGLTDELSSAGVALIHLPLIGGLTDGTLLRQLKAESIETAIFLYETAVHDLATYLTECGIKTVWLASVSDSPNTASIDYDNVTGMNRLLEHLVACGHKHIGFIYADPELRHHAERLATYRQVAERLGMDQTKNAEVRAASVTTADGRFAALQLLEQYPQCSAICAMSDRLAFGVYQAAMQTGKRIPHDIAVSGFDDSELATHAYPPLTTVSVPYYKMARRAGTLITSYFETRKFSEEKIIEPTQLMIRESTQAT